MADASDFEYLRIVADRYGELYGVHEFNASADNITEEELRVLREVYETLWARSDYPRIGEWTGKCLQHRGKIPKREFEFSARV